MDKELQQQIETEVDDDRLVEEDNKRHKRTSFLLWKEQNLNELKKYWFELTDGAYNDDNFNSSDGDFLEFCEEEYEDLQREENYKYRGDD